MDILNILKSGESETIEFKAGQFIQFEVPEYEGCEEPVYRAYSVASASSSCFLVFGSAASESDAL